MKKRDIIDLIRYYTAHNDIGFRNAAYKIATDFSKNGDGELAQYITSLLSKSDSLVPQSEDIHSDYFEKLTSQNNPLFLPDAIIHDLSGIMHAVSHHMGINKFLFQGAPGTGKTEAVRQLGRLLKRTIYMVNFTTIIDSKLGQTQKNMTEMFKEIQRIEKPSQVIFLFDELDAIALDRTNNHDIREMGRTTSTFLKLMDRVSEDILIIATTNLFQYFDKALIRRFDFVVDFNRYTRKDLMDIAEQFLNIYLRKMKIQNRDVRLFRKILQNADELPYPGTLKNKIKTALAFSDTDDSNDYFRRLYTAFCYCEPTDIAMLKSQGFTIREIEKLTHITKSSVSRQLKKEGIGNA